MAENENGHVCPLSVVKWLNNPLRKLIQNPRKNFGKYINPGSTVVDLGCGGGFFTVELARMVGETGRVIAVDLQTEMLNITRDLATKKGVIDRITLHQCETNDIGLSEVKVDFALAFYVVHEVPDQRAFLKQVSELLKPDARFMMIEPKHHVTASDFERILADADYAGLKKLQTVRMIMSRGILFAPASANQAQSS